MCWLLVLGAALLGFAVAAILAAGASAEREMEAYRNGYDAGLRDGAKRKG